MENGGFRQQGQGYKAGLQSFVDNIVLKQNRKKRKKER